MYTASSAELKRPDHRSLFILPQNVAIVGGAGTRIQLTCSRSSESTNARVMWAEFASSPNGAIISDGQTITPGHPNAARYEIVHDTDDQFDLVINDLDLADGDSTCARTPQTGLLQFSGDSLKSLCWV